MDPHCLFYKFVDVNLILNGNELYNMRLMMTPEDIHGKFVFSVCGGREEGQQCEGGMRTTQGVLHPDYLRGIIGAFNTTACDAVEEILRDSGLLNENYAVS